MAAQSLEAVILDALRDRRGVVSFSGGRDSNRIDLSDRRSKHLDEFSGRRFDYVVTLCDRAREACPEFSGSPGSIHWSMADPAREGDTDAESYPAFERTARELDTRIGFLLPLIDHNHLPRK